MLIIEKIPDAEIIKKIKVQNNNNIGRALYHQRQSIKKDCFHWLKLAFLTLSLTVLIVACVSVYGEPKGVFISKYFSVTNMSTVSDNANSTNIIGILKNIGNKTLNAGCNPRMQVELYDSKNNLKNVIELTPVGVSTLEPNKISPFKVWTNTPTFDHYVVRMVDAIG
jgi:hypothetical protein